MCRVSTHGDAPQSIAAKNTIKANNAIPSTDTMSDCERFHNERSIHAGMLCRWPACCCAFVVPPTSVEPTQHVMISVIMTLRVKIMRESIGIGSAMITVGSRWACCDCDEREKARMIESWQLNIYLNYVLEALAHSTWKHAMSPWQIRFELTICTASRRIIGNKVRSIHR